MTRQLLHPKRTGLVWLAAAAAVCLAVGVDVHARRAMVRVVAD